MDLDFVNRSEWGAQYAAGFGPRAIPLDEAWLHHSVTLAPDLAFTDLNADSLDDDEVKAMRTIERIGQQRFGGGFSYNIAGMPSGRLYVGCGVRRVGAHTAKRNTRALGVVIVGDYSNTPIPEPLVASLAKLLKFGKQEGWLNAPRFNGGHRDAPGSNTACPGNAAHSQLPEINRRAAGETAPVTPAPKPAPLRPVPAENLGNDMARLIKSTDRPHVFGTDGLRKWHVPTQQVLEELRHTGIYGDGRVHTVSRATIDALPTI